VIAAVLYASVALPYDQGFARLEQSIATLLDSLSEEPLPRVLWSLRYEQRYSSTTSSQLQDGVLQLPALSSDLALEDEVLESVKRVWAEITGEPEDAFMKFEAREGSGEDDA